MTDCECVRLDVEIPKSTYDRLIKITKRQNAALSNNVSRLLNVGIDATYKKWPNLKSDSND